jgi:hypothetical protein
VHRNNGLIKRKLRELRTARAIIKRVGGNKQAAALTKRKAQHITNWKAAGRLPAETFLVLSAVLAAKGFYASPKLWSITPVRE